MDDSGDLSGGEGIEKELAAEVFKDLEMGEGEIDLLRGECDFSGAVVLQLVIEVPEAVHEGV